MSKNETKPETTEEVQPNSPVWESQPVISKWVAETNDAVEGIRKSDEKLFDVVRGAYLELSSTKGDLELYKDRVNIDRSTINKIITIVRNTTLTKFSKDLPVSWNTLYSIAKMSAEDLADAIEREKIHPRSTLAEVNKVRKVYEGETNSESDTPEVIEVNTCWVDLEKLDLDANGRNEVITLLTDIHKYGIKVTGVDLFEDRKAA